MSERHTIWVNYDTSETDLSCVTCIESNNGRAKMLVGYIENNADEVYKIVSEQGYLNEHDAEIRADERAKVIGIIHTFFAEELDKLETDYDGVDEYYKDTQKANELLSLNKRLCEMLKEQENERKNQM